MVRCLNNTLKQDFVPKTVPLKKTTLNNQQVKGYFVHITGVEPAHSYEHRPLKATCLPIPPYVLINTRANIQFLINN